MKLFIALSAVVLLNIISDYSCHANVTAARDTQIYDRYSSDEELVEKRAAPGTELEIRLVAVDGNNQMHEIPEGGALTKIIVTLQEWLSTGPRAQQCSVGNTGETKIEIVIGGQTLDIPLDNVPAGALDGEDVNFQTLFSGVTEELSADEKIDLENLTWPKLAHVVELLKNPDQEIQELFRRNGYLNVKVADLLAKLVNERKGTKQAKNEASIMKLDLDNKTKEADGLAVNLASETLKKQDLEDQLKSVNNNLSALKASETRLKHEKSTLEAAGEKKKAELAAVNEELAGKLQKIIELEKTNKALEAKVVELNSKISSMSKDLDGLRTALEAEKDGRKIAEADAKHKEATLKNIKTELEGVRKERTDIQGKADQLERDLSKQTQGRYDAEEMLKKAEEGKKRADEEFGKAIEKKQNELLAAKKATAAQKAELEQDIAQQNYDWDREKNLLERQVSTLTNAVKELTQALEASHKNNRAKDAQIESLKAQVKAVNASLKLNKCHCPGLWRHFVIMLGYLNPVKESGMVRQVLSMFFNSIGLGKILPMSAAFKDDLPKIGKHFDQLVKDGVIPAPNLSGNGPAAIQNGAAGKAVKKPAAAGGKRK